MNEMIFLLQHADMAADFKDTFYVIEKFHDPQFVTDEDGNIKSFENYQDAADEAADCQQGYVICFTVG
jgi:hypothetical protein